MTLDDLLGTRATLTIRRLTTPGAYLALEAGPGRAAPAAARASGGYGDARTRGGDGDAHDDDDVVLLPRREVPEAARVGDTLEVFLYLDSEERLVATTQSPKLALGEVAFLEVSEVTHIGAFVNWGLGKELLVPFSEQTLDLQPGDVEPIGLYRDKSGRLAGTMHVGDVLGRDRRRFKPDEWIDGVAWRNEPEIGLFVILERSFVGLVPASEPHRLHRGQVEKFRVAELLPDGKVVLSLRKHAHHEIESDAAHVLAVLKGPRAPRLGDRSHPDAIRDVFGLSKKAFKRAVGRLLKERTVEIAEDGAVVLASRS